MGQPRNQVETRRSVRLSDPVAIIGAGLSGLAAGCLLARNGVAVRLFEANGKVGGCCATTTLEGFTFNDGAVYLPLVSLLDHGFARLGLDRGRILPVKRVATNLRATLPDGTVVTLGDGLDVTVEGRRVDAARVHADLRGLVSRWEPVLRWVTEEVATYPFSPWRVLRRGWRHLPKLRGTVAAELRRHVADDAVRAALSGVLLYAGVPPEEMPASALVGLVAMMGEGFHLPEGGMGKIPDALATAFEGYGGRLFLNSEVGRIAVSRGRVCGVEVEGQGRVEAAAVISTTSAMATYGTLLDPGDVPAATLRRVGRARLSHRAVSLQLGLSNRIESRSFLNMVVPTMERQREVFRQDASGVEWPIYFVPTTALPTLAPPGGSVIEMFHPVPPALEASGGGKGAVADAALRALRRAHDLDIAVTRVRGPGDFAESLHLYHGALYGLSPIVGPHEQFPLRSPLRGLFLAGGQSTHPGYGVPASVMSGIFAAEALMEVAT
jgi:phytoene desaturase